MESTIISELATQLIIALVPVAIGALAWVARWVVSWVKSKVASEHYAILAALARQAVQAVDQTLKAKPAAEKLAAAKAVVTGALLAKGIRLDESAITAAIESAVYQEKLDVVFQVDANASTAAAALPEIVTEDGALPEAE